MAATGETSPPEFQRLVDAKLADGQADELAVIQAALDQLDAAQALIANGVTLDDGRIVRPMECDDGISYVVVSPDPGHDAPT